MHSADWTDIAEYVAAGSIDKIAIDEDFDSVLLDIVYLGGSRDGAAYSRVDISLRCVNVCYLDLRRLEGHPSGPGTIFDASLRTESSLIADLRSHRLNATAGCLCLEDKEVPVYHLEIVGEISVSILCEAIVGTASDLEVIAP